MNHRDSWWSCSTPHKTGGDAVRLLMGLRGLSILLADPIHPGASCQTLWTSDTRTCPCPKYWNPDSSPQTQRKENDSSRLFCDLISNSHLQSQFYFCISTFTMKKSTGFLFLHLIFFFFWPHGSWNLSSPTKDQTRAHSHESEESLPLDHQGVPCSSLSLLNEKVLFARLILRVIHAHSRKFGKLVW